MTVNERIIEVMNAARFEDVWALTCPLKEKPNKWATFNPTDERPADFGDDQDLEWMHYMQIHVFWKGNQDYTNDRNLIRSELRKAGFSVSRIHTQHEETARKDGKGVTHLTIECNIAEEDLWQG